MLTRQNYYRNIENVYIKTKLNKEFSDINTNPGIFIDSISPGSKVELEISLKALEEVSEQSGYIIFFISDKYVRFIEPGKINFITHELPPPKIEVFMDIFDELTDGVKGNNNRKIELGETVELLYRIKNTGKGLAKVKKIELLPVESDPNIKIINRNIISEPIIIYPDSTKSFSFLAFIGEKVGLSLNDFKLMIGESREKFSKEEKIRLPVFLVKAIIPKPPILTIKIDPDEIELEPNQNKTVKVTVNNAGDLLAINTIALINPLSELKNVQYNESWNIGDIAPKSQKEIMLKFETFKNIKPQDVEIQVKVIEGKGFNSAPQSFKLRTTVDTIPPSIVVLDPTIERGKNLTVNEKKLNVKVRAEDKNGVSRVLINGAEAKLVRENEYSADVKLFDSLNVITVVATDTRENQSYTSFIVINKPSVEAASLVRKGVDYALLFATDKYDYWNRLVNPINDIRTISEELKKSYKFAIDVNENPTQGNILSKLREYALRTYSDDDQLLIFFAGHGQFDEVFKEGFIVTKDSKQNDEGRISYISHNRLRSQIDNIPCKHIFLVIDACFGGTFDPLIAQLDRHTDDYSEVSKPEFIQRKMKFKTRKFLTSGGKEYVSDGRPGQYSPFVRKFLEALRSYGGNDGILTLGEINNYVEKVKPEPRFGEFGSNEPGSDFIFIAR
jgi:hypothetical protein